LLFGSVAQVLEADMKPKVGGYERQLFAIMTVNIAQRATENALMVVSKKRSQVAT